MRVVGKLPVPGRLTTGYSRANALAVGAGGGCLDIFFSFVYHFSPLSLGDGPV